MYRPIYSFRKRNWTTRLHISLYERYKCYHRKTLLEGKKIFRCETKTF